MDPFSNTQALKEGWWLNERWLRGSGSPRIMNTDWSSGCPFGSDEEALAFVQQKAAEGSAYHLDALARVAFGGEEDTGFSATNYQGETRWINNASQI